MNSEKAARGLSRGVEGVLDHDETWGGTVTVAGNVVVAEGSTLRVSPGTSVIFSGMCRLQVMGRLIVEGTEGRPVSIGSPGPWGGIHAAGRARVIARHALLANDGPNIFLSGQGRMDIADCRLTSARDANATCRGGFLKIKRCAMDGPSDCAIYIHGGRHRISGLKITDARAGLVLTQATVSARDLAFSRCQEAMIARDGSTLELDGAAFEGGKTGVAVIASKASIRNASFHGFSETALSLQGEGGADAESFRISGMRITDSRAGMVLTRATVSAKDIACSRCQEAVLVRDGSALELDGAAFESGRTGLAVSASKVSIRNASFRDHSETTLIARDGSTLELDGAALDGGRTGLAVLASRVSARNASFQGFSETALSLQRGGGARFESCRLSRCRVGMILADGSGDFTGLAVDECPYMGVYAPAGRHRFLRYSGPPIVIEEPVQVELDGRSLSAQKPARWRESSRVLRLVLRTQGIRPFRAAYRGLYSLGEASFRAMARLYGGVVSCDAWRGWKRGDWSPGVSDLDFVVVARVLSGRSGKRWLAGFWRRYARLKRAMPFLGETVVVLEPELQEYLDHGGVRAGELAAARRGRAPGLTAEPKRQVALWAECASSYTRLIEWLWHRDGYPWAFRRAQLFKSAVDLLRHLPETGNGPSEVHASRKAFWDGIRETPFAGSRGALQELLDEDSPAGPHEAVLSALWAHLLHVMHQSALETESRWNVPGDRPTDLRCIPAPQADVAAGHGASLERWSAQLLGFQDRFGAGLSGALFSDLYPSYAILTDEKLSKAGLEVSMARSARCGPSGGLAIVLSRRLWRLWTCLPFSENPVLFMDAATAPAGRLVPMRGQFSWGDVSAPTPPPAVLLESARQSLAQLRLIRRWLGSPSAALNGRCALHYLLSRAMGLRLLTQRRIAAPFFDLDRLAKLYSQEFPDSTEALSKITPETGTRSVDGSYWECHDFLESALSGPIG